MRMIRLNRNIGISNILVGRFFCLLLLLLVMISFSTTLLARADIMVAQSQVNEPIIKIEDLDGDGIAEALVETDFVRIIFNGKTGSPSVYYLKGQTYKENIYPPVIQEQGFKFTPEVLKPFIVSLKGMELPSNYNISLEEITADKVIVKTVANVPIADSSTGNAGLALTKRYTFYQSSYHFDVECLVTNLKDKPITVGDEMSGSLILSYGPGLFMDPFGPVTLLGLGVNNVESYTDITELNSVGAVAGHFNGIGMRDQYFCIIMESGVSARISASAFKVLGKDANTTPKEGRIINCVLPSFNLGAMESRSFNFKIYAGPMILDQLSKIGRGQVSEYGFLSTMLLRILQFFYNLIPDYGLAIILLTIVVRLMLYPLTLKQTKSMAKMQKIQPKVQDLKDRYKDNPQKFNEEVLELYKKNEVNPLGGCLPLLLQLPILIALYNTIRIAVELRKVPFLWIPDLSKGDPIMILPFAIAALMYYQQGKMTTDPQQKQMMALMPVFMFAITWSLPSGLLVYWFASSVIGLIQQLQANRISEAIKEE